VADWAKAVDPASGATYFTSGRTGESVWQKPRRLMEAEAEARTRLLLWSDATCRGEEMVHRRMLRALAQRTTRLQRLCRRLKAQVAQSGVDDGGGTREAAVGAANTALCSGGSLGASRSRILAPDDGSHSAATEPEAGRERSLREILLADGSFVLGLATRLGLAMPPTLEQSIIEASQPSALAALEQPASLHNDGVLRQARTAQIGTVMQLDIEPAGAENAAGAAHVGQPSQAPALFDITAQPMLGTGFRGLVAPGALARLDRPYQSAVVDKVADVADSLVELRLGNAATMETSSQVPHPAVAPAPVAASVDIGGGTPTLHVRAGHEWRRLRAPTAGGDLLAELDAPYRLGGSHSSVNTAAMLFAPPAAFLTEAPLLAGKLALPILEPLVITDFGALFGGDDAAGLGGLTGLVGIGDHGALATAIAPGHQSSLPSASAGGLLSGTAGRIGAAAIVDDEHSAAATAHALARDQAQDQAFRCVRVGRIDELEDLLLSGLLDVNQERDASGNTLLIVAAQAGNRRIVKQLIKRGAAMNAQNNKGNTALHYCFAYKHAELAAYLSSKGADDTIPNAEGLTCHEGAGGAPFD
jgi:hypothetical protein